MAIETEKKYRLTEEQRQLVLENLKAENAEYIGEDFEVNEIYGGGILKEKKAALRVRKTENKTLLTFKQRLDNDSQFKHQIEHETEVADAASLEAILENLEFIKGITYEKKRQTWNLRNVEIVLDELPFGLFMEIEGRITDITLVEILLEAETFETVHETYPRLTALLGREIGDQQYEARFE